MFAGSPEPMKVLFREVDTFSLWVCSVVMPSGCRNAHMELGLMLIDCYIGTAKQCLFYCADLA